MCKDKDSRRKTIWQCPLCGYVSDEHEHSCDRCGEYLTTDCRYMGYFALGNSLKDVARTAKRQLQQDCDNAQYFIAYNKEVKCREIDNMLMEACEKITQAREIAQMQALCLAELRNEPAETMPWADENEDEDA